MSRFSQSSAGGMLSGIKNKLGLADNSANDDAYYDDYEQEYGSDYEEDYEEAPSPYAGDFAYQNSSPVSTRPVGSGTQARYDGSRPRLVSFDDVRASTQVPDSLSRDPLPPRRTSNSNFSARRSDNYGNASDFTLSGPAPTNPSVSPRERAAGYESLFAPTTGETSTSAAPAASSAPASSASSGFDPYQAYEGSGAPVFSPARSMKVLKPVHYDEVENIAKTLKAGDVVVLQLRNTSSQLSKRILDFAFGVSSALDASVDCVADKVFVITRDKELTSEERTKLRNQGVF